MKKIYKRFARVSKKISIIFMREYRETKEMAKIYLKKRGEDEALIKEANKQLLDIVKILFLVPISILPGSVIIITLLELIAKAFKCSIFPKKQKF